MPASAIVSAMVWSVACRMFVLAPWPRTRRWLASAGRTSRAETFPFSGVARNFISLALWFMSMFTVTAESRRSDYRVVKDVTTPAAPMVTRASFVVEPCAVGAELA